jgi:hypothetical protein
VTYTVVDKGPTEVPNVQLDIPIPSGTYLDVNGYRVATRSASNCPWPGPGSDGVLHCSFYGDALPPFGEKYTVELQLLVVGKGVLSSPPAKAWSDKRTDQDMSNNYATLHLQSGTQLSLRAKVRRNGLMWSGHHFLHVRSFKRWLTVRGLHWKVWKVHHLQMALGLMDRK